MSWLEILAVVVALFLIFKFLVKPLFKVVAFVALALLAWWFLQGGL